MLIRFVLCSSLLCPHSVPTQASTSATPLLAQPAECGEWQDCRDRALAAKEAGDFERFHDLAWRTVQKGPRNDPALMTLLARAQSLSGRPGDALVMLQRLAGMGEVVRDVEDNEDFRRVRALPGWPDLQARFADIAVASETPAAKETPPERPPAGDPAPKPEAKRERAASPSAKPSSAEPARPPEPAKPEESRPESAAAEAPPAPKRAEDDEPGAEVEDAVMFTTIPFEPAGLAYDAVSNRFIVGDRRDRKLNVVGERSQRLATLAGEESAGFGQVEAIAIDAREGDLWVASTPDGEPSKLHKLQLISGRLLFTATLPEDAGTARIQDIAVGGRSVVFALDGSGRRVFALKPGSQQLELVRATGLPDALSMAVSPDEAIYLAGATGLFRVDSGGGSPVRVKHAENIETSNLACIRWHGGSLVGVRRQADGTFDLVRVQLAGDGGTVTRIELLEKNVALANPSAVTVNGDELFYLAPSSGYSASGGMDATIRRVKLR